MIGQLDKRIKPNTNKWKDFTSDRQALFVSLDVSKFQVERAKIYAFADSHHNN